MNAAQKLREKGLLLSDLPDNIRQAYFSLVKIVDLYNNMPDGRKKRLYRDLIIQSDDEVMNRINLHAQNSGKTEHNLIRFEAKYLFLN